MSDWDQLSGCRPMIPLDIVHFGYMLTWRTIVIFLINSGCTCAYRLSSAMRILRLHLSSVIPIRCTLSRHYILFLYFHKYSQLTQIV